MKKLTTLLFLMCVIILSETSYGMVFIQEGPDKDRDHPTHAQPSWAKGIVELTRHDSRIYSIGGMGGDDFYFQADPNQVNELLALFSKSRMRDHEVWIKAGTGKRKKTLKDSFNYNVGLQIAVGKEPQLTIFAGDDLEWLEQFELGKNIILHCDIKDCSISSPAVIPERKMWFGKVKHKDGKWESNHELGIKTRITLWQDDFKDGVNVGRVGINGAISIAFSDEEMTALKNGKIWLTVTVGNWLTEAKSDNTRIDPAMLSRDATKARPTIISRPEFYHGRIIFEDGSSPVLDPMPWPGAEIMVDFSYAGSANMDHKGYFQVFFTDEQYETLKSKKSRRNIYIPSYTKKNQSSARFIFPVSLLSKDKSSAGVVKIPKLEEPDGMKIVAKGNNEFAFDLYAKLINDEEIVKKSSNLFFSPYSISTALAMTWAGTRGETEKQFAETMHYPLPSAKQHGVLGKLEKQLNSGGKKGGYQLSVANALWGQEGEPFRKDFLELTNKYYGASIRELNFASGEPAEISRQIINGWVEKKTKDKIKELIAKGLVDDAILVLTNAIYFKGDWQIQFDKKNTKERPFIISSEEKVQVETMHLKDEFKYWGDENLQVLELPYKGEDLSMMVLLPKDIDGLGELEKQLTVDNINTWTKNLRKQKVEILLPKFKITWGTFELAKILNKMGLPLDGDYSGITNGGGLSISNILHKAFVAVDEKGTEAAAATAVIMGRSAMPATPKFKTNHPFIFMIRDNKTGSVLFMGRVMDPTITD